ncbi:MAG TPA: hypothetical protein VFO60_06875 [Candidatus Dormibacteraeota bacterium]|nr:hypothetical protein [Candidatus Dormibacteraeota bacterium]
MAAIAEGLAPAGAASVAHPHAADEDGPESRHHAAGGRLSRRRLVGINALWFGNGAHWQPIFVALIPEGAKLVAGRDAADDLVGRATAAGGLFALLVPLLVGWLSDRTRSRWGRRRPRL